MNLLEHLREQLEGAALYNSHQEVAPKVIIWTDKPGVWAEAAGQLRAMLPNLHTLGAYDPETRTGPDSYLLYELGKNQDQPLVFYLPGVSKSEFTTARDIPESARHLYASQFVGQFWIQKNHKDWTPMAILQNSLNIDIAQDNDTKEALIAALPELLHADLAKLKGKKIEASDLRALSAPDPAKDLLECLNDPGIATSWTDAKRTAFTKECEDRFGFSPEADGDLVGAEKLANQDGPWEEVWTRFCEAPRRYPQLIKKLQGLTPTELFPRSSWPSNNAADESKLGEEFVKLSEKNSKEIAEGIAKLTGQHRERLDWVWAELGMSPLARALSFLNEAVELIETPYHHGSWDELTAYYLETGVRIEQLMRSAMEEALLPETEKSATDSISKILQSVYIPWVDELASHAQTQFESYPVTLREDIRGFNASPGKVYLFIDGLRYDVALELFERLEPWNPEISHEWSALPSVTWTSKYAWEPLAVTLNGNEWNKDFAPSNSEGKKVDTNRFPKVLKEIGITHLNWDDNGDSSLTGWITHSEIDSFGHKEGWKMVQRLPNIYKTIAQRVAELFSAGWNEVEIVTDHGWLVAPEGLPQSELRSHLVDTKWGRCARPQEGAIIEMLKHPWFWNSSIDVVTPPGVKCFKANQKYAHGGVSLQECCIPRIKLSNTGATVAEVVNEPNFTWSGLRLRSEMPDSNGYKLDIRKRANDPESSVAAKPGSFKEGKATALVEDDGLEGEAAFAVILKDGQVVKQTTIVIGS